MPQQGGWKSCQSPGSDTPKQELLFCGGLQAGPPSTPRPQPAGTPAPRAECAAGCSEGATSGATVPKGSGEPEAGAPLQGQTGNFPAHTRHLTPCLQQNKSTTTNENTPNQTSPALPREGSPSDPRQAPLCGGGRADPCPDKRTPCTPGAASGPPGPVRVRPRAARLLGLTRLLGILLIKMKSSGLLGFPWTAIRHAQLWFFSLGECRCLASKAIGEYRSLQSQVF